MNQISTLLKALCCCYVILFSIENSHAQCAVGETELLLSIATDDWGYECYWQITPQGNTCGAGMIAQGGNPTQIGCNGAGQQDATTAQGYADNTTIVAPGFCLTIGETYTLHYVDDYTDGGAQFSLNLFGFNIYSFSGSGDNNTFDFIVQQPLAYDVACQKILSYNYVQPDAIEIRARFFNPSSTTISDVMMNYSIDGEPAITGAIIGLNVPPFSTVELIHPTAWSGAANGNHELNVWISSINNNSDMNTANDEANKMIIVGPATPNVLDDYLAFTTTLEEIAGSTEGIQNPRDLDFHPTLTRNELWVVLKSTENDGGTTVKISNAGETDQTELTQQDGNAWHFMSLPTGISFSRNENFATSPGVFDANHDGGTPFTGPALWSSDPAIYAQPSGGNGSHLDMLHESPYSMGITWEKDNKFWVTCGDHNEIMSYDFRDDHGPGNSDHSDGVIYKYPIPNYAEDTQHEVPDHLVFDHATGWLYACNSQQNRVIRINTATGNPGDVVTPHETVEVYQYMDNFVWQEVITAGLDEPSGIDIVENRMIVSNYNNGDINLYDISGDTPILLGVIATGSNGIMGIKIGPDGLIWYVNSVTDKVMRVAMSPISVEEKSNKVSMSINPNPANEILNLNIVSAQTLANTFVQIVDMTGRVVLFQKIISDKAISINIGQVASGVYNVVLKSNGNTVVTQKLIVE